MAQRKIENLPSLNNSIEFIQSLNKPTVAQLLAKAQSNGETLFQPRCGVGDHEKMKTLLRELEISASPDILTLTIDAHTRLKRFDVASSLLSQNPDALNGYPLVSHGWQRGRDLNKAIKTPLQVRHGSPDPKRLFETAIASGITSFEGGGISYNLPYSKNVPLQYSLDAWQAVDEQCGELAQHGIIVDREIFGTLTAVLVPPSISLAISIVESMLAAMAGVQCISVAYPQTGHAAQDVAALRAIPNLARKYLPSNVAVHPVFHEFMGVFPKDPALANALILYGALIGKTGGAAKVITKTNQEAVGIPTTDVNAQGINLARASRSFVFNNFSVDNSQVEQELEWILNEVDEILEPILEGNNLKESSIRAFESGQLDIPFSASRYAKSEIVPLRDSSGAIRYHNSGNLAFSERTKQRQRELLKGSSTESIFDRMVDSINYFSKEGGHYAAGQ